MENKYAKLRTEAINLRKKGYSYNEIRKEIKVAKSTLSIWLKSVLLKPEFQKRLYTKQIEMLSRGSQSQKERRSREVAAIIKKAEGEIKLPLSANVLKLMGAALYWAEGSKGKRAEITNSDPRLIVFMIRWIEMMFEIKPELLKARLNIYSQQDEKQIIKFWSELTKIPFRNFGKTYIKPANKGFKKNNLYYGTISIGVPKSADICCRINGWVNGALKDIEPRLKQINKKWHHLQKVDRPVNLKSARP